MCSANTIVLSNDRSDALALVGCCQCRYLAAAKQWISVLSVYLTRCYITWSATGSCRTSNCRWLVDCKLCHILNIFRYSGCTVRLNDGWKVVCEDWYGITLPYRGELVTSQSARFGFVLCRRFLLLLFILTAFRHSVSSLVPAHWITHSLRFSSSPIKDPVDLVLAFQVRIPSVLYEPAVHVPPSSCIFIFLH